MKLKKGFKKMVSVMLTAVMCLAMCLTGFAAGECSITVENSIGGVSYSLYKIFDATYSVSGDDTLVSYTFSADNSDLLALVETDSSPFTATLSADGSVYIVTLAVDNEGKTATDSDVAEWLNNNAASLAKAAEDSSFNPITGTGSSIKWTGLDAGYYLVVPSTSTVNPTLISVTTAAPDGIIVDKNQNPTLDKEVDKSNYSIGDTATYTIEAYVPTYVGEDEIASYTFTDVMDAGLSYDEGSIEIVITGSGAPEGGINLTNGENCTVTYDSITNTLTISYNIADIIDSTGAVIYPADAEITITYTATVTEAADDVDIHNDVKLTWKTIEGDEPEDPPEDETQSYTYGFNLKKADGSGTDANQLEGAVFSVTDEAGNKISFISGNGYYEVYDGTSSVGEGQTVVENITVGSANIWGFSEGIYTLTEITAPAGYNLLSNPVIVVITETENGWSVALYDGTYDSSNPDNNLIGSSTGTIGGEGADTHNVTSIPLVTIVNNAGTLLPGTGGMGTTLFYVIGGLLVLIGAAFVVARIRLGKTE